MSRLDPRQTSSLDLYPLSSSSSRQALFVFAQLLSSCAGPHGKNHIVRNTCGGHVTMTSTCSRLLSSMRISRSELKLVVSAITGHLQQRGDCGLFMAHMCLQLTKPVLDLDIHHSVISSTFQTFVSIIVNYIKSDNCDVRVKADFSNVKVLLAYVRSILTSKTLLNIQPRELHDLSLMILNAFVKVIPSVPLQRYSSGVFVIGEENRTIKSCKSVDGIMLDFPELPMFGDPLELKWEVKVDKQNQPESYVKVALVTCSLSGDMEDTVKATVEATEEQFNDMEACVLKKITALLSILERNNISIILCQKVIHPRIKSLLGCKGIISVDRLGSQPIPYIRDLTGCQPITSILQTIEGKEECIGKLTSVTPCFENNKSYICLRNSNASVMTLVVCAEWEERLSELKHCVSACLQGLESLVKEPQLLLGGGCWQIHCSHVLKEKVLSTLPEMSKKMMCTESRLRQLLTVFRSCLHQWCLGLKQDSEHLLFDQSSQHCWRVPKDIPVSFPDEKMKLCGCGMKAMSCGNLQDLDIVLVQGDSVLSHHEGKDLPHTYAIDAEDYDCVVFDSLTACMEAFHKGVLTTGLLLSIGQFICDRN